MAATIACAVIAGAPSLLLATPPIQIIGLTDAAYQGRDDEPQRVNAAGQVIGFANRLFNTGTSSYLGADLWYYDPTGGTTRIIGLTDSAHTNGYGANANSATFLSNSGQAVGYAARYAPTNGSDVWLYDPGSDTTRGIGLTDPTHTYNGVTSNLPTAMNANGQVAGYAARYANGAGNDAWRYDFATNSTQIIGLADAAHMQSNGYRDVRSVAINAAGQVAGFSQLYSGTIVLGNDAWLYNPATNSCIQLGLTDSPHVSSSGGGHDSRAVLINNTPRVVGTANRYSGNLIIGSDAWLYDGPSNSTRIIGLTDSAHLDSSGSPNNAPIALNDAGLVVGNAPRTDRGQDAWLYDPSSTSSRVIGLTDAGHTDFRGSRFEQVKFLNSSGQAVGTANSYAANGNFSGVDGWFYDSVNQQVYTLNFSGGDADTTVSVLGENGAVLGTYYNGAYSQYYWSERSGFFDLASLVRGGLAANGWDALDGVTGITQAGKVVGWGRLAGQSNETAFLLSPVMPGDANSDGTVDTVDFNILASNFSQSGRTWEQGDFNGDGNVDTVDFNLLAADFGRSLASAGPTLSTIVPEPALGSLLLSTICCAARTRPGRHKSIRVRAISRNRR